ncbi:MAG TPA: YlqD family protein, partial [Desulfobacteria bacterium]|nr:YlqD family protein [Desulfobacteria bacterium]
MSGPLTIKRTIVVKVKVTEDFKKQMASDIQDAIRNMDAELQQLDFQEKRMVLELERKNLSAIPAARQQVEAERQKRMQARNRLTEQLKGVGQMAIGSE